VNSLGVVSAEDIRRLVRCSDEFWYRASALNLMAICLLCKRLLLTVLENEMGHIVPKASLRGRPVLIHGRANASLNQYCFGLDRALALEAPDKRIIANSISPGPACGVASSKRVGYGEQRALLTCKDFERLLATIGRDLAQAGIASITMQLNADETADIADQVFNVCRC
jgi:NAD(P)-dependent dehydrogenase (short-subunit alcohol dehydrogenase family)